MAAGKGRGPRGAQFRCVLGIEGGVMVMLNAVMREHVARVFETLPDATTSDRAFAKALRDPVVTDPPAASPQPPEESS